MVNTCAGIDPLCTEQVNKIYVYFFKWLRLVSLSSVCMLSLTQMGGRVCSSQASQVVYLEHRTVALALIFDSSSFDSGCAQEKGSN